jgi:hypothetical protein
MAGAGREHGEGWRGAPMAVAQGGSREREKPRERGRRGVEGWKGRERKKGKEKIK